MSQVPRRPGFYKEGSPPLNIRNLRRKLLRSHRQRFKSINLASVSSCPTTWNPSAIKFPLQILLPRAIPPVTHGPLPTIIILLRYPFPTTTPTLPPSLTFPRMPAYIHNHTRRITARSLIATSPRRHSCSPGPTFYRNTRADSTFKHRTILPVRLACLLTMDLWRWGLVCACPSNSGDHSISNNNNNCTMFTSPTLTSTPCISLR